MSGDSTDRSHPARKVNQEELKEFILEKHKTVPAVTTRIVAQEFSEVEPQTVNDNLKYLADDGEICRLNDGDVILWWYPRETDEAGEVPYGRLFDDSIDYNKIEPTEVPRDVAEEIALERLPFYRPGSLWSQTANLGQLGVMISLGLIVLGIGGATSETLGLQQATATGVLQLGFYVALISLGLYLVSLVLDMLAARGHIERDPFPIIRRILS
jgi:hypothetical protein